MVPQTCSAFSQSVENYPVSEIDPYSKEVLIDPWETFADLQRLGSAVWLTKYEKFALTRYDDVVRALKDTSAFSSASGVMMNDDMNQVLRGNTLCSDGEDHRRLRRIIANPLTPMALNSLKVEITEKAEELVDRLVAKGSFCATAELATGLPVDIVASAVGLPQEGRERMLVWAEQMFNCFGPLNDRTRAAFPVLEEMMHYARTQAVRGRLKPGATWTGLRFQQVRGRSCSMARRTVQSDLPRCGSRQRCSGLGTCAHLAFGWGPHVCVGQHLAKLEMAAIFWALATKVERLHVEEEVPNDTAYCAVSAN
jgi:cytochrome P450